VGVASDAVEKDHRRTPGRRISRFHDMKPQSVDGDEQIALRRLGARPDGRHQKRRDKYQPAHNGHYV